MELMRAPSVSVPHLLLCLVVFMLLCSVSRADETVSEFAFNGFNDSNIYLDKASIIKPSGVLKLTNRSGDDIGHAFYPDTFRMLDPVNRIVSSFSTCFVFAIKPQTPGEGGYGLAFVVSPTTKFENVEAEHYLGLFNSTTDKEASNHMLVIEFDTRSGYGGDLDEEGNHVGININGMNSIKTEPAAYYENNTEVKDEMKLESGKPIQAWIEYNATTKLINVTISPIDVEKPLKPLLSTTIAWENVTLENMYVGFSASTGKTTSFHYVLGWSFRLNGAAPPLNISQLPPLPNDDDRSNSYKPNIVALIVSLSVVMIFLSGILIFFMAKRKRMRREGLEDWELDYPHRFQYKDLHTATKGFKESEKIGSGGFGKVYKGTLPSNKCEVAVKKIVNKDSIQGMREFVAEVESLGRLRHKNLVNLQGWCKYSNELLLVYDYIPYGSLYSLLFNRNDGFVLSWEQRYHILKGIAAGLLYLHEEWEQVVIHRDVKSSNVLIDSDMHAKLGDFGLARLYDHGQDSHITNVVGTIGYIAPELARTGKASASSDVFAYGVLLLEVATGKHPIGSGHFVLVDWVMESHENGRILGVVDQRLIDTGYIREEMELVLLLGLLCSHPNPESRPTMRQVVRYLNQEETLPALNNLGSAESRRANSVNMRFMEYFSSGTSSSSNVLSSMNAFSSASMIVGR